MKPKVLRALSSNNRDDQWKSTLTQAEYRWGGEDVGWEVKTIAADWHPVKAGMKTHTVYGQSGEKFEVIT